jgi:hypothetical protein
VVVRNAAMRRRKSIARCREETGYGTRLADDYFKFFVDALKGSATESFLKL